MKKQLFILVLLAGFIFTANAQDYCLHYNGSTSRVRYANDSQLDLLNGATDYTIEAWFYPTDADIHGRVILKRWHQFAITLFQNNNRRIYFTHYTVAPPNSRLTDQSVYVNTLNNVVNLNQWNHVAVINNSTDNTLKIYMNGVDVTVDDSGNAAPHTALTLEDTPGTSANFFVASGGTNTFFNGYVDKVRIKKTAEDIANLHTSDPMAQPYITDADTVVLMNFDEGSGNTTVNEPNSVNAELRCFGGCNDLPVWEQVQTVMATPELENIAFETFPNPVTNGILHIQVQDGEQINRIFITDMTGKEVFAKNFERQQQVKLQLNLRAGFYLVNTLTKNGVGVEKIMVK